MHLNRANCLSGYYHTSHNSSIVHGMLGNIGQPLDLVKFVNNLIPDMSRKFDLMFSVKSKVEESVINNFNILKIMQNMDTLRQSVDAWHTDLNKRKYI